MYIRTKDGIYETRENGETYNGFGCKFNNGTIKIHKKDILNQSENLDELCDRFVAKTYDITQYWVETKLENAKMYCGVEIIYGAIWTEKGLIYVAKMNQKGDLELL